MRKLLVFLKKYRRDSILAPLFKMLEAALELLVPLVIAAIIDVGIGTGDKQYILRMCMVLVGLGIVGILFSITAQYFAARAAVGFSKEVRHALFAHIQGFSYAGLDGIGTSTLITRLTSDMNQVQSGVNMTLRLLLRSPFVVLGAMLMAFTVDAHAALIFVVAIPVLSVVVLGIMALCIPLYRRVQQKLDGVLGATRQNLVGVRVLRAFCKEKEETAAFQQKNEELTTAQKLVGRISALMNPATYVLINLAILVLIYTGALRVQAGLLTQGAVVALYNYMSQILVELIKLANLIINLTKSVACGNRIQAVLEQNSALPEAPTTAQGSAETSSYRVEFRAASLQYPGAAAPALENITLSAASGETIGVIGGTGSGKSSLVNLIPRFYDVSAGAVLVDGVDVREYPPVQLRDKIGMVPQRAVLFSGTVRQNLQWGRAGATDEELYAALDTAQAREIVDGRAEGLDFMIEQGGKNLSGGQRQRLTIARALVRKPEILILDDSASALDFATDAALRKALRALEGRPTVFLVSQRTASLQFADRIAVLDDGMLVGLDKHEALLQNCEVYREIYDSQFKKEAVAR